MCSAFSPLNLLSLFCDWDNTKPAEERRYLCAPKRPLISLFPVRVRAHKYTHTCINRYTSFPKVQPTDACRHSQKSLSTNNLPWIFFFFFIFCLWNHDCWNRWNINSGIFILSQQAHTHTNTHTDVLWVKHPRQKQSGLKWKHTSREEISEPRHLSRETFCSCVNNCCTVSPTPPGFTSKPAMKMHSVLFGEHELHSNMLSSAPVWSYRDTEHIIALYMTIRPK